MFNGQLCFSSVTRVFIGLVAVLALSTTQANGQNACNENTPTCTTNADCDCGICNASKCCLLPNQTGCAAAADCCASLATCTSGICCFPPQGGVCNAHSDCCSGVCGVGGACCQLPTQTCTVKADCCASQATCTSGICCFPAGGGVCSSDAECCDDGDECTSPNLCQNGICVGSNPVVCTALDQCHDVGICDPATGVCSDPPLPDGTPCDDDDECTQPDSCQGGICIPGLQRCRVSISKKGSLLYYSKIELRWNATAPFAPRQDTFLTIVNDYPEEVCVQWYFINGDAPLAAVFAGDPLVLTERAHRGWNSVNCTTRLSEDETTYMSALTGGPLGCQPFTILDPGALPGRPDPENPGQRVLRGYAIAFAVDSAGREVSWNHLTGHVDIVNYADRSAWEYNSYAFQCVANVPQGAECSNEIHRPVASNGAGTLHLDGKEYDFAFDKLLFDFYSVGSVAFSLFPRTVVTINTDLTLYPVSVDLRTTNTNSDGPVITRAKFDVWNQNEDAQSGVNRCITCWDQTLLSNYDAPNSFLIFNIQTNKGKARIDGIQSDSCDAPGACCSLDDPDCTLADLERIEAGGAYDRDCSEDAALLGVSDKILAFSGAGIPTGARTDAGTNLVGQGVQEAVIKRELVDPSDPLTNGLELPNAGNANGTDDGSLMQIRQQGRDQHRQLRQRK